MSKRILIAGGTGLIGKKLIKELLGDGWTIHLLSRSARKIEGVKCFTWNPAKYEIEEGATKNIDAIINLAGAPIADKRWTTSRKKMLIDSRVQGAATLQKAIEKMETPPSVYLSAAATGIYGDHGEDWVNEQSPSIGRGFLVECCEKWEEGIQKIEAIGIRTVWLRIGIVLSTKGGALPKIALPSKFGIAAYFGNGKQYYPWIHIDDVVNMFLFALSTPEIKGAYNASAPEPVSNWELTKMIGNVLGKIQIPAPGPAFIMRGIMGELAEILLKSTRMSAKKILDAGFLFQYADLEVALKDIFENKK